MKTNSMHKLCSRKYLAPVSLEMSCVNQKYSTALRSTSLFSSTLDLMFTLLRWFLFFSTKSVNRDPTARSSEEQKTQARNSSFQMGGYRFYEPVLSNSFLLATRCCKCIYLHTEKLPCYFCNHNYADTSSFRNTVIKKCKNKFFPTKLNSPKLIF